MAENDSLLQISPNNELVFTGPFTKEVSVPVVLTNVTDSPVYFKLMTNYRGNYIADPDQGLLKTGKSVQIEVKMEFDQMPSDIDQFKVDIQSIPAPSHDLLQCRSIWRVLTPDNVFHHKLKVRLVDTDRSDNEEKGTDAPIRNTQMDSLECKVCLLEYNDQVAIPRLLSCGHTICETCATKMLDANRIICPLDRKITIVPGNSIDSLSKNFSLLDVLQERNILKIEKKQTPNENEPYVEMRCRENAEHMAQFYCEQCDTELCDSCFNHVHQPKVLSSHRKIPISEKPIRLPKCKKHPYNTADLVCTDFTCFIQDKFMCHTCLLSPNHKGHTHMLLSEQIQKRQTCLTQVLDNITKEIEILESEIRKARNCTATYNISGEVYHEKVQQISNEFDAKKMKALEDFESFVNRAQKGASQRDSALEGNLMDAQKFQKRLKQGMGNIIDEKATEETMLEANSFCNRIRHNHNFRSLNEHSINLTPGMELKIDAINQVSF